MSQCPHSLMKDRAGLPARGSCFVEIMISESSPIHGDATVAHRQGVLSPVLAVNLRRRVTRTLRSRVQGAILGSASGTRAVRGRTIASRPSLTLRRAPEANADGGLRGPGAPNEQPHPAADGRGRRDSTPEGCSTVQQRSRHRPDATKT
jgi:hypothetical protein